jgi:hypothetical protein
MARVRKPFILERSWHTGSAKNLRRPREGRDPASFAKKTLDSRLRGNDDVGFLLLAAQKIERYSHLNTRSTKFAAGMLAVLSLVWGYSWVTNKIGILLSSPFDFAAMFY